ITPLASATQSSACAGAALSSDSAKASSRIPVQPPAAVALFFVSRKVIEALVPLTERFRVTGTDRGQSTRWTGFRRSRRPRALGPVGPVTLRRHLSMALPLSESRRHQRISLAVLFPELSWLPWLPMKTTPAAGSRRRQEIDRIHDRQRLHALLR